jgi:hypothetical protein
VKPGRRGDDGVQKLVGDDEGDGDDEEDDDEEDEGEVEKVRARKWFEEEPPEDAAVVGIGMAVIWCLRGESGDPEVGAMLFLT